MSIKEVIVVEGSNDTKRLKSFFEVDTIETHGLGLSNETIEYIRKVNEKRGVILFLDPDSPGEKIRNRLNSSIPNLKNAFILKEDARTKKKVGVEHASREALREALENLVNYGDHKESISLSEFNELGLSGKSDSGIRRQEIIKRYHLGRCNAKTLLKRLNMLGISKKDIENDFQY